VIWKHWFVSPPALGCREVKRANGRLVAPPQSNFAEIHFFAAVQRSAEHFLVVASFPVPLCGATPPSASQLGVKAMGRGILLWLLGVPIPIILLIALLYH